MYRPVRSIVIGCALGAAIAMSGCVANSDEEQGTTTQASKGGREIHPEDNCDPATFGALCSPAFHGTTTLAQFNAELDATQRVAAWEYGGGQGNVSGGTPLQVDNHGGETHTFTVVAKFGGGRVPILNQKSGNTVVAPECVAGANATNVDIPSGSGIAVSTGASGALKPGTYNVQCCIHPWMRTTVVVK